jgi:hypothetical protein
MTDERIIAYLLEELPEDESERFEEECFDGESWPARLASVEGDLIDEYLRGELAQERRQSFERNYLTTAARVERVRVAAALLRHLDDRPDAAGEFLAEKFYAGETAARESAAAEQSDGGAGVVEASGGKAGGEALGGGVVVGGVGTGGAGGVEAGVGGAGVGRAAAGAAAGSAWGERLRAFWAGGGLTARAAAAFALAAVVLAGAWWLAGTRRATPETIAALTLSAAAANRVEGAEAGRVRLAPDTDALRVSLALPGGAEAATGYRVELEGPGGGIENLQAEGWDARAVSVLLPAPRLSRGRHALRLFAATAGGERRIPGSYYFVVE